MSIFRMRACSVIPILTRSSGFLTSLSLMFFVWMKPLRLFSSLTRTPTAEPGQSPASKWLHTCGDISLGVNVTPMTRLIRGSGRLPHWFPWSLLSYRTDRPRILSPHFSLDLPRPAADPAVAFWRCSSHDTEPACLWHTISCIHADGTDVRDWQTYETDRCTRLTDVREWQMYETDRRTRLTDSPM